jgi:hypothetical protein
MIEVLFTGENIQLLKTLYLVFFFFSAYYDPEVNLDSKFLSNDLKLFQSGSNPDPDPIHRQLLREYLWASISVREMGSSQSGQSAMLRAQ